MKITGLDSESGRYIFLQLDLPKNNTGISPNSLKMSKPFPEVFGDFVVVVVVINIPISRTSWLLLPNTNPLPRDPTRHVLEVSNALMSNSCSF